jgi:hypothetical protein
MKLMHAFKVVDNLITRMGRTVSREEGAVTVSLALEEQTAIWILWKFARQVILAKASLVALHRAVGGEDDLNQNELLLDGGDGG